MKTLISTRHTFFRSALGGLIFGTAVAGAQAPGSDIQEELSTALVQQTCFGMTATRQPDGHGGQ